MAKRKPNKRIQNKKSKQEQTAKLSKKGITQKEQKRMTKTQKKTALQKIHKAERQKELKQQKKDFLKSNNISGNHTINGKQYTTNQLVNLSWDKLNQVIESEKRKKQRKTTQENKIKYMTEKGIKVFEADKFKNKTYKEIDAYIYSQYGDRTVYQSKEYLSVMWSDVTGESDFLNALHAHDKDTTEEMITMIHNLKDNAVGDGSAGFKGVAKIIRHTNKNVVERRANEKVFDGYNYKMVTEETRLISSNEWTVRGYANMMLSVMERTKPEFVRDYYDNFKDYALENCPEIYRQIFE